MSQSDRNATRRLFQHVREQLQLFARWNGIWCPRVYLLAAEFDLPEQTVRAVFESLFRLGIISLKTWSYRNWREVSFGEWPTAEFFRNKDDSNYIRVKVLPVPANYF
ncbi:MAG: hypothetical protein WA755_05795 [Candidatus Acidiferrales bacterium]